MSAELYLNGCNLVIAPSVARKRASLSLGGKRGHSWSAVGAARFMVWFRWVRKEKARRAMGSIEMVAELHR